MSARQNIVDLIEAKRVDGQAACGLVLDPNLVAIVPTKMRIFGLHLESDDAPADLIDPVDESSRPLWWPLRDLEFCRGRLVVNMMINASIAIPTAD